MMTVNRVRLCVSMLVVAAALSKDTSASGRYSQMYSAELLVNRVWNRLQGYCWEYGEYPDSLSGELLCGEDCGRDPWGSRLTYLRGSRGFELFSNGPDRIPYTVDDIYATMRRNNCEYSWIGKEWVETDSMMAMDPVDRAGRDLLSFESSLRSFRDKRNSFPKSLVELFGRDPRNRPCMGDEPSLLDPWGEEYVYRNLADGYELFSKGPDRVEKTGDDVWAGAQSDWCWESRNIDPPEQELRCEELPDGPKAVPDASVGPCDDSAVLDVVGALRVPRPTRGCGCSFVGGAER
jgi:hypothetical protein